MIKDDAGWKAERLKGIGASESSAIIGLNPYMSNLDLWRIKTGRKQAEDISSKEHVIYGHAAEPHLRELFALDYPKYRVEYGGNFDLVRNDKYPFIFATLDGRLTELETGRLGVLEIKTTEIMRSMQREKWHDKIPDNYYTQCLWQMIATGFDYAVLSAQLKRVYYDDVRTETRRYYIERDEVKDDIEFLTSKALEFWECVKTDREPALILPEI